MKWQETLNAIVNALKTASYVEGVFLGGSLANQNLDDFSDIDLGIVTRNSAKAFVEAHSLRYQVMTIAGTPLAFLDRGWKHCKMIAVLYGKTRFPPIGLERVAELGAGPKPIPRRKLSVERLASAIEEAITNKEVQSRAARLGEQIRTENGVVNAVEAIGRYI